MIMMTERNAIYFHHRFMLGSRLMHDAELVVRDFESHPCVNAHEFLAVGGPPFQLK